VAARLGYAAAPVIASPTHADPANAGSKLSGLAPVRNCVIITHAGSNESNAFHTLGLPDPRLYRSVVDQYDIQSNSRRGSQLGLHTLVVETYRLDNAEYNWMNRWRKKLCFRTKFVRGNKVSFAVQHNSGTDSYYTLHVALAQSKEAHNISDDMIPSHDRFQDIKFVAIDTESAPDSRWDKLCLSIGVSILDTRDIAGIPPGPKCSNWTTKIKTTDYIIRETDDRHAKKPMYWNCPRWWRWGTMPREMGEDVVVSTDQLREKLDSIFNEPDDSPAMSTMAIDALPADAGGESFAMEDQTPAPSILPASATATDALPAHAGSESFAMADETPDPSILPPLDMAMDAVPAHAGIESFAMAETAADRANLSAPLGEEDRYAWDNVPFEDIDWADVPSVNTMYYLSSTCHWELKRRKCNKNTCSARFHLCRPYVSALTFGILLYFNNVLTYIIGPR
jgi:hypothetical protein